MQPSEAELGNLSLACERLWGLDDNRAEPGRDYQLNLQVDYHAVQLSPCIAALRPCPNLGITQQSIPVSAQAAKKSCISEDVAAQRLFSWVSAELLRQRRTYALFVALLDNYHRSHSSLLEIRFLYSSIVCAGSHCCAH